MAKNCRATACLTGHDILNNDHGGGPLSNHLLQSPTRRIQIEVFVDITTTTIVSSCFRCQITLSRELLVTFIINFGGTVDELGSGLGVVIGAALPPALFVVGLFGVGLVLVRVEFLIVILLLVGSG